MITYLRILGLRLFISTLFIIVTLISSSCTPGRLCTQQEFTSLSNEEKANASYHIDADVIYRNEKYKSSLFSSNNVNELLYVRMTQEGKYVKEGNSTTFAWMKNGKRIMEGDPRIGGTYDEVDCHTLEIAFDDNIHLLFESISNEKYTLKTVLYNGEDVQNRNNSLGYVYKPVYYMMDVDLRIDLASN